MSIDGGDGMGLIDYSGERIPNVVPVVSCLRGT